MQGTWVQSLVGALRSHMLHGTAEKINTQITTPPKNAFKSVTLAIDWMRRSQHLYLTKKTNDLIIIH